MNSISFKTLLIFFLMFNRYSCPQQGQVEKYYTVSGSVMTVQSYCGGARPSEEMMREINKPIPAAGKQLFVIAGKTNSKNHTMIKSFTADSSGNFRLQLPAGNYCIVEEYKTKDLLIPKNDQYSTWDANCLMEEYSKCDYNLDITNNDVKNISVVFHIPCAWGRSCLQYHGPLPPSAPHGKGSITNDQKGPITNANRGLKKPVNGNKAYEDLVIKTSEKIILEKTGKSLMNQYLGNTEGTIYLNGYINKARKGGTLINKIENLVAGLGNLVAGFGKIYP